MTTLTKRIRGIKFGERFVRQIRKWYEENDKDMPVNWMMRDPEWWVEYKRDQENE